MNVIRMPVLRPGQGETRGMAAMAGCLIMDDGMKTRLFYSSYSQVSPDVKDKTDILSTSVSEIHFEESMFLADAFLANGGNQYILNSIRCTSRCLCIYSDHLRFGG